MSQEQVQVGTLSSFGDDNHKIYSVGDTEIGVFRLGEKLVAYENYCPHMGGPVCQGKVIAKVEEMLSDDKKSEGLRFDSNLHVICPWHGYEFDLETGSHPGDKRIRLRSVKVDLRGDDIYLTLNVPAP